MPVFPAPAVGQVSLVTFKGVLNSQLILSTFKYQITIVGTDTTWDAAATNLYTSLSSTTGLINRFLQCAPTNYTLLQTWIQLIFPTRYKKLVFATGLNGTYANVGTTSNLAAVISRQGVLANKHNNGSLHIPYSNLDSALSQGIVSPAMLSAMSTLGSVMLSTQTPAVGLTTWQPGLFPAKATSIQQWVNLYTTVPQTTARVMRRRTVGVGK